MAFRFVILLLVATVSVAVRRSGDTALQVDGGVGDLHVENQTAIEQHENAVSTQHVSTQAQPIELQDETRRLREDRTEDCPDGSRARCVAHCTPSGEEPMKRRYNVGGRVTDTMKYGACVEYCQKNCPIYSSALQVDGGAGALRVENETAIEQHENAVSTQHKSTQAQSIELQDETRRLRDDRTQDCPDGSRARCVAHCTPSGEEPMKRRYNVGGRVTDTMKYGACVEYCQEHCPIYSSALQVDGGAGALRVDNETAIKQHENAVSTQHKSTQAQSIELQDETRRLREDRTEDCPDGSRARCVAHCTPSGEEPMRERYNVGGRGTDTMKYGACVEYCQKNCPIYSSALQVDGGVGGP